MRRSSRSGLTGVRTTAVLAAALAPLAPARSAAQTFDMEDVLSPPFPYDLVAARRSDRIAWLAYERGTRNVYTAAAPDYRPRRLTAWTEDDGRDLSGLQISDDGRLLLFVRGHTPNREGWIANPASDPDGMERAAWAIRAGGGEPWRVVEARDPVLSPDGRWTAYARDGQVYRSAVAPAGAAAEPPRPLFRVFGRNGDPVWSPDSRRIAFVSERDDHAFVGVYDTEARTVTWLAPGVDRDAGPAWSSDGNRVAFVRRPGTPFDPPEDRPWWQESLEPDTVLPDGMERAGFAGGHTLELWVADAGTGEGHRVWHSAPGDERFTDVRSLDWVGGHLVFRSEPGPWEGHRFAVAVDQPAGEPVELTPGQGMVEHVAVSPDGRDLYYTTNADDIDRRHLWRVPVAGGDPVRVTTGDRIETYPAVTGSGDVAMFQAGPALPQSVAVLGRDGASPRVVTPPPASFPADRHVEPRPVMITAEDGVETHGQLFLPPDLRPGERRPALLFIHGGPRRQMLLGYHYMHFYHMAYAMNQYFASRGYVTLSVNYRSGIGYGTGFRNAEDYGRRGSSEYRDILAAGRWLAQRSDVDPDRIGLWGLSYGGILTAQGLARNSDVFAAGVDMAGVHLYGDPGDTTSTLYRASAVSAIDGWTSPVLLVHGDDDRNVDFSQTVGLVQLLRARGVPYELIVYPDEVHDFLLFSRWIRAFRATEDFFVRKLGPPRTVPAEDAAGERR